MLSQTRSRGKALGKRHFFVERRDFLWVITALVKIQALSKWSAIERNVLLLRALVL